MARINGAPGKALEEFMDEGSSGPSPRGPDSPAVSRSAAADVALASTERRVRLGFAVALAALALSGVASWLNVVNLDRNAARVEHTHEVIGSLELLLSATTDSETAERGYVITGDENYLAPYRQGAAIAGEQARRLRELTADNSQQQQRLEQLVPLVNERLDILRGVIDLRRAGGLEAARTATAIGRGKQVHDQIRSLVASMEDAEQALLKEREQRTRRSSMRTQFTIAGSGLFALLLVGLSLSRVRRDFAARARAERALQEANDQLEQRVQKRTAQLGVANERMRAIFDTALDGIVTMDHEGLITEFNPAAEAIFGYHRERVMGQPLDQILIPESLRESHRKGLAHYLATGAGPVLGKRVELSGLRADGSEVAVELSINRIPGSESPSFSAFLRDITERRKAAETRARLALIVQSSDDAIASKTLEGIITSWNRGAERLFGYTAEEAVGMPMAMLVPPDRADEEPMILERVRRGESTDHFETERVCKDGSRVQVSVSISPIFDDQDRVVGASKIARDITDRKLGEAKVQAQLARLNLLHQITRAIGERQDLQSVFQVVVRTLEEHLPLDFCCICLHEAAQSRLIVANVGSRSEALATELAMPAKASVSIDQNGLSHCVQGKLIYEPAVDEVFFPFPQRLARGGLSSMVAAPLIVEKKVFGVLIAARRKAHSFSSGECEFLKQVSEHVALAAHQIQLYEALQQSYDDLRQTQKAVMQQERLLALGQMASGIAHDINNAISPVALYTESLLELEPGLSERARFRLQTIQRAIDDVARTVVRMREFYRPREPQLTLLPVDLNALVQQVVDLTRARWGDMAQQRGVFIEMRTVLAPELPAIMGADNEIREALINLIFNAVDAMPDGGSLTVQTRVVPERKVVQVEVTDSGIGMDEDTRRRCLEPFFSTKGDRGTGLGLAMVYGAVQRHSAEIEIDSEPGKGTSIRLSFAIPTTSVVNQPESVATVNVAPLRILVVDDDQLVLNALRDALKTDGHDVTTADGGQAGIDAFLASCSAGQPFPVVITDLGMPHVDGRKVSSAIKTAAPKTVVFMLTGWGQRLVAEGDVPPHVDRVLSKPPKLRELRQALASALPERVG